MLREQNEKVGLALFIKMQEMGVDVPDTPTVLASATTVAIKGIAQMMGEDLNPVVYTFNAEDGKPLLSNSAMQDPKVLTALIADLQSQLAMLEVKTDSASMH